MRVPRHSNAKRGCGYSEWKLGDEQIAEYKQLFSRSNNRQNAHRSEH